MKRGGVASGSNYQELQEAFVESQPSRAGLPWEQTERSRIFSLGPTLWMMVSEPGEFAEALPGRRVRPAAAYLSVNVTLMAFVHIVFLAVMIRDGSTSAPPLEGLGPVLLRRLAFSWPVELLHAGAMVVAQGAVFVGLSRVLGGSMSWPLALRACAYTYALASVLPLMSVVMWDNLEVASYVTSVLAFLAAVLQARVLFAVASDSGGLSTGRSCVAASPPLLFLLGRWILFGGLWALLVALVEGA